MPYLHSTRQKGFDGPTGAADTMIQEICGDITNCLKRLSKYENM
jgi:hypothetical protein